MGSRPPRKSRKPATAIKVVIRYVNDDYTETPGYTGHNNGSFDEAGYRQGRGQFGFQHDVLQ